MDRNNALTLPLLDYLAYRAGCTYLSDLKYLNRWEKVQLAQTLEQIAVEAASLRVWNDALDYLAQAPPEQTAEAARSRLITALSQPVVKN